MKICRVIDKKFPFLFIYSEKLLRPPGKFVIIVQIISNSMGLTLFQEDGL